MLVCRGERGLWFIVVPFELILTQSRVVSHLISIDIAMVEDQIGEHKE